MNLTEGTNTWELRWERGVGYSITHLPTNEVRLITQGTPNAGAIAQMSHVLFMTVCSIAFVTGRWEP